MSESERTIGVLLTLVAEGRLDALTDAEMHRLEHALNTNPALADQIGGMTADGGAYAPAQPTDAEWERVWAGVDTDQQAVTSPRRLWRIGPLSVAAALVMMVGLWRLATPATALTLTPDDDVEIVSVETFGDDAPFIIAAADDDEFPVIWVIENEGA